MGIVVHSFAILYFLSSLVSKEVLSSAVYVSPYTSPTGASSHFPTSALGTSAGNLSALAYASTRDQYQNKSALPTTASITGPCRYLEQSYAGGDCVAIAGTVDVYYWPEPDADTSCLSIIGEATTPLLQDATITTSSLSGTGWTTVTYWGCTAQTGFYQGSYLTTAQMATIDGLSFKSFRINPWSEPCGGPASAPASTSLSFHSLQGRGYSLAVAPNVTYNGDLNRSTVTSGGFTFTSPSIYANFHDITVEVGGEDSNSGYVVCSIIPVSMLTFSPGELSTIQGGIHERIDELGFGPYENRPLPPQPYNFSDLPCPPQEVMEANWYMPEPGVPYQPSIFMPQQLSNINPVFGSCEVFLFTGYDPPRTLAPATAMAPIITPHIPQITAPAAAPSPTQDPGPAKTAAAAADDSSASTVEDDPSPPQTQGPSLPEQTVVPGNDPGLSWSVGDPISDDNPQPSPPGNNEELGQGSVPSPGVQDGSSSDPEGDNEPESANIGVTSIGDPIESSDNTLDPQNYAIAIGSQKPGSATTVNGQLAEPLVNGISIAGFTVTPDAAPITADGTRIFLGSSALVVGSVLVDIVLPPVSLTPGQATEINGQLIQPLTNGLSIAGQTLTPGAAPITVSGTPISLGPSNLIIGSSSIAITLPRQSWIPGQVTTINGQVIQPLTDGGISIAGQSLAPGAAPITISGTPISLGPSSLIIGSSSIAITLPRQSLIPGQVTTIDGQVIQPLTDGGISIAGRTLTPGASPITISGTPISLGPSSLIIGSNSIAITLPPQSWIPGQVTTVDGQVIQPLTNGAISIDGTTLTPGALPITVSGTAISLGSAALFIGSSTVSLDSEVPEQIVTTVAGQAITADPTAVEVGSLTLTPGGPGTSISGTLVSLNSDGELIVGTKMIPLETMAGGLGGLIMGGLGPGRPYATSLAGLGNVSGSGNGTATGNGVQAFDGRGKLSKSSSLWKPMMVILFATLVCLF